MEWVWRQATGELLQRLDDSLYSDVIATGYAGMGAGQNNPAMQCVEDVGPIPRGWYTIGDAVEDPTLFTLPLTPDPDNDMCGRSGFLIHGDSIQLPGWASQGCIVLDATTRQKISASGLNRLQVIDS